MGETRPHCDNNTSAGAGESDDSGESHSNLMELDMTVPTVLDPTLTIKEIVARFPETIPVFNRFGLEHVVAGVHASTQPRSAMESMRRQFYRHCVRRSNVDEGPRR
jgi:hypothetical protein